MARIWRCCGRGVRAAAAAAIQPLAWEPPYAEGVALKRQKKKKIGTVFPFRVMKKCWKPDRGNGCTILKMY